MTLILSYAKVTVRQVEGQLPREPALAAHSEKAEVPEQPLYVEMPVIVVQPNQEAGSPSCACHLLHQEHHVANGSTAGQSPCDAARPGKAEMPKQFLYREMLVDVLQQNHEIRLP